MKNFCYLKDRLNASDGSQAVAIAGTTIEWLKFRKCGELLNGRKLLLKIKG